MIHPADRTDATDALATFQATQAELTLPLGSGDITRGPGTRSPMLMGSSRPAHVPPWAASPPRPACSLPTSCRCGTVP